MKQVRATHLIPLSAFLLSKPLYAANGSAELMAGYTASTLDVRMAGDLAPKSGFFAQNIATMNYDDTVSAFGLIDLTYASPVHGLNVVAETQFFPEGVTPRLGFQYAHDGDTQIFFASTMALRNDSTLETVASFSHITSDDETLHGYSAIEHVTNINSEGHSFSIQRIRLGVEKNGYVAGVAYNFLETGNDFAFDYNFGLFLKKDF